jgi:quercetin dioxygenase-like cupin family protein
MINRRDALGSALMAFAVESVMGAGASGKRWPDEVFKLENGQVTKEPFGENTVYFEGSTPELKYLVAGSVMLHPGAEPHPPHQHPEEEFMLVTEGTGEILVGAKPTDVGAGALMFCEGNRLHGIKNTGQVPMRFFYVKWLSA